MLFPFLKPDIPHPNEWVSLLEPCYEARYFSNFGALAGRLETRCAEAYLDDSYAALLCASNTLGLQVVMSANLMPGDKVALPDFTFAATLQAVLAAGMKPVICDIDRDTWELSTDALETALEAHPDLKAVIHVRPFGLLRDISSTRNFCESHGLRLIVDAAAGLASPGHEEKFGSAFGEIEVFSLHATKVFGLGEGGLIAMPKSDLIPIKAAMNFGFQPDRQFVDGTNAKIDEFRAAIGLATLPKMKHIVAQRAAHAAIYDGVLKSFPHLTAAKDPGPTAWSTYPVMLHRAATKEMVGIFADKGIEIKKYYWPSVSLGYRGNFDILKTATPVSDDVSERMICLPVYNTLEEGMQMMLINRLSACLEEIG